MVHVDLPARVAIDYERRGAFRTVRALPGTDTVAIDVEPGAAALMLADAEYWAPVRGEYAIAVLAIAAALESAGFRVHLDADTARVYDHTGRQVELTARPFIRQ